MTLFVVYTDILRESDDKLTSQHSKAVNNEFQLRPNLEVLNLNLKAASVEAFIKSTTD